MSDTSPAHGGQRHDRLDEATNGTLPPAYTAIPPPQNAEIPMSQKMLSAVTGSVLTSLLVTPLDVVRVRLQSQNPTPSPNLDLKAASSSALPRQFANLPSNLGVTQCCREVFWVSNTSQICVADSIVAVPEASSGVECAVEETQRRTYTSTLDGLRKIARNEGLATLWRGLSPTLVMAVPGNVIYFAGYDWLRTSRRSPMVDRVPEVYAPLIAGSTARVIAALFVSPIELFRTRAQASTGSQSAAANFKETLAGVTDMVHSQGYRTLWRGLTLTLWRDVPFSAFYWWGYEASRNVLTDMRSRAKGLIPEESASVASRRTHARQSQDHTSTLVDSLIGGSVSGAVSSIITTPFDVGKTRQQVYADASARDAATSQQLRPEQRSMPRFLWHIFKEEGVPGLFRGWVPRVMKVAPACAIMISSYEIGKKVAHGNALRKSGGGDDDDE